jgi:hypothetical protein
VEIQQQKNKVQTGKAICAILHIIKTIKHTMQDVNKIGKDIRKEEKEVTRNFQTRVQICANCKS